MRCFVVLVVLFCASLSRAQADLPDAGLPDASVGETGAERASEEEDNGTTTPCLSDNDCDRGFQCRQSRCVWRRWREATFEGCSCGALDPLTVLALAVPLVTRRRRYFALVNFTK